jgi:hypothetical protein
MAPTVKKPAGVDVLGDIVKGTRRLIDRLRGDVDEFSLKGRMKLEILSLKNKRARAFRELGMRVFILARKGVELPAGLKPLVGEIERLDAGIAEQDQALRKLEAGTDRASSRGPLDAPADRARAKRRRTRAKRKAAPEDTAGVVPEEVVTENEDVGL